MEYGVRKELLKKMKKVTKVRKISCFDVRHQTVSNIIIHFSRFTLHEKCPNTDFFWSEYGKMRTRKNSIYGHFYRSVRLKKKQFFP